MENEAVTLDEIRPLLHQHIVLLTAAGEPPARALAIAAEVAVMIQDDALVREALEHARRSLAELQT